MMSRHIGWDTADPEAIFDADIVNGRIVIGSCAYSRVVVVKGGKTEMAAYQRLKDAGVECVLYDGSDTFCLPDGVLTQGDSENIQIYRKSRTGDQMLFIFNNSSSYNKIKVNVSEGTWVYDAEADVARPITVDDGYAEIAMQGYGSVILISASAAPAPIGEQYTPECENKALPEYVTSPDFVYKPIGTRSVVPAYSMRLYSNGTVTEKDNVAPTQIREHLGTADTIMRQFYYRPGFDSARRFDNVYPCKAEYSVKLKCVENTDYLLFDKHSVSGSFKLCWNGKEIPCSEFKKKRIYDVSNFAVYPEWQDGENLLEIKIDSAGEFDGVTGDIFVMKQ